MTVAAPAALLHAKGCLPYPETCEVMGYDRVLPATLIRDSGDGYLVVVLHEDHQDTEAGVETIAHVDEVAVPLTPDVQQAVCRRLAARFKHTGAQAYWLDVEPGWAELRGWVAGVDVHVREWAAEEGYEHNPPVVPALAPITDPDAALLAILHTLPDEVAP